MLQRMVVVSKGKTSVTKRKRKRRQMTERDLASRTSWMATLVVTCASAVTMTSVNALVIPEPKKFVGASVHIPTQKFSPTSPITNRRTCQRMSRTSGDDETEREELPIETATTTTDKKNDDSPTTTDSGSGTESKDLVDAIFKGNSPGSVLGQETPEKDAKTAPMPVLDKIDAFLDKPFFDPDAYEDDDDSFFGKFARLVKTDYELFEAVFVACFFLLLITITKDLLRAQMAANSIPSGRLF